MSEAHKEYAWQQKRFHDEGKYILVDGRSGTVTEGTYFVDTRPVNQYYMQEFDLPGWEWELMVRLMPIGAVSLDSDDVYGGLYKETGEVWRLWDVTKDMEGRLAQEVHVKARELAKSGIGVEQFEAEITMLVEEIRNGMANSLIEKSK